MAVSKSDVDNMRDDLSAIEREVGDVLSKDLEVLYNMKSMMESCLEIGSTPPVFKPPFPGGFSIAAPSTKSDNKVFKAQIESLRELLQNHCRLLQEESSLLSEVVMNIHRELLLVNSYVIL